MSGLLCLSVTSAHLHTHLAQLTLKGSDTEPNLTLNRTWTLTHMTRVLFKVSSRFFLLFLVDSTCVSLYLLYVCVCGLSWTWFCVVSCQTVLTVCFHTVHDQNSAQRPDQSPASLSCHICFGVSPERVPVQTKHQNHLKDHRVIQQV